MRSDLKKMMDYCTYCPKMCRFSCPVSEATKTEAHTPWGKMEIGRWILDKTIPLSEENVLPVYQCTNCLHCQNYCEHLNDVPEALKDIRTLAVENYVAPPNVFEVGRNFAKYNNPYGVDILIKEKSLARHYKKKKSEILFFPSCHTLRFFPERVGTYFELFKKLNISNVTMIPEAVPCCGEQLRTLGFKKEFQEVAEIQYYSLKGYKYIITDSFECCFSFKAHYGDLGFSLEKKLLHLLEFIAPFLKHSNYRTHGKVKGRLAIHEPSFMTRHMEQAGLSKNLVSHLTGFSPIELSWSGLDSLSSGVEGSYNQIFPKISEVIAERTLQEVASRRIKKLITVCSKTEAHFQKLTKEIEIQDIFEFFNQQILKN